MPWTASDAKSHDRCATGKKAHQWAAIANSVLSRTGDDAQAIRVANSKISCDDLDSDSGSTSRRYAGRYAGLVTRHSGGSGSR